MRPILGSVAFECRLAPPAEDADSGDRVRAADFTELAQSGRYHLEVPGVGRQGEESSGR